MLQRLSALVAKVRGAARGRFFSEFLRFASSSSLLQFSRLASGLLVAALLGPGAWGYWYLLNLIIAYGALTQLGALNGMNREVPAALGVGGALGAVALRRSALGVVLATTGGALVMLLVGSLMFKELSPSPEFALTLGLLLATQLYAYATTSLRSTTNFRDLSRLQWLEAMLYPCLSIGGATLFGLSGFIGGQIVTLLICSTLANRARNVVWHPSLERNIAAHLISVGFPIMLVGLTYTLLSTVDRWVVAGYLGSEALGHYSIAIMALSAVGFLPNVISQQFYPRIAFQWSANRDVGELRVLASKQRNYTFAAVVPVVVIVFLLAPIAVRSLLPQYEAGIPAVLVTAFVPLASTVGQGYGAILHVLDRQYWYLGAIIIAVATNVVVSLSLVQSLDLVGVAIGTVAAFSVLAALRVLLGGLALRRAAGLKL